MSRFVALTLSCAVGNICSEYPCLMNCEVLTLKSLLSHIPLVFYGTKISKCSLDVIFKINHKELLSLFLPQTVQSKHVVVFIVQ